MATLLPHLAFWSLGLIWGSNFIFMKWAADFITPLQIVFLRVLFGFLPVLVFALFSKALRISHFRYTLHFLVMSLLATSIYYFGFAKGTSLLLSGIAGALSGAIPLFAFVAGALFLADEKITLLKATGVLVGFLGVLMIANPFEGDLGDTNLEGVFYMVMGSFSIGISFVYAKKFLADTDMAPVALATYQLGFALLSLALVTDFTGMQAITEDSRALTGLIVGLGLLGTGVAYISYYYIVEKLGAVTASSSTYIPPIVALAIGALFVGEDIAILSYLATGFIFAGVFLLKK